MRNFKLCLFLFIIFSILFYPGCKIAKPMQMPVIKEMPDSFSTNKNNSGATISWKDFFSNIHLQALIDTALHNNTDLQIALQRVEILNAQLMMSKGALSPTVNGIVSAGADKFGDYTMTGVGNFDTNLSPNINDKQKAPTPLTPDLFIGFRSSWEIDIWGKIKEPEKSGRCSINGIRTRQKLAVTTLVSEIAMHYYNLLALDNELQIV